MSNDLQSRYQQATVKTMMSLKNQAQELAQRNLSRLSLPEIDQLTDLVGRIVPAGNVPGVILNGLSRLTGRRPPAASVKRDIGLLFKGVEQALDRAVYATFFAGPAAVIWGYQNLLKLAGKDPDDAFPEGTWQFYVDYALREDTARHATETHGFGTTLAHHGLQLTPADRIAAWAMAALQCLQRYPELLANEWYERVATALLRDVTAGQPDAARYAGLYQQWQSKRPYGRGADAGAQESYPAYRRRLFETFLEPAIIALPVEARRSWLAALRAAEDHDLPAYQQQMSILAYLDPGPHSETRVPVAPEQVHVGVIIGGRYLLLPLLRAGQPADPQLVRAQIAAAFAAPQAHAQPLDLATLRRTALGELRGQFSDGLRFSLDRLRTAPILINADRRPRALPLAEIRRIERGAGDHALTIIDAGETMVFDQSHIFFDGAWGAALAEMLTHEALGWARYFHSLPPAAPFIAPLPWLDFPATPADRERIARAPRVTPEAAAESDRIQLKPILALRTMFKQRSDLLQLTINDLLVLYRAIHAQTYQPAPALLAELQALEQHQYTRQAAQQALAALRDPQSTNPAILIPIDASARSPRDRLYPMTVDVPLHELDLVALHAHTLAALREYQRAPGDRAAQYEAFDQLQRRLLAALAGFGQVMGRAKEIAIEGQSGSVGAIKLLAHMPTPLQRLLDAIPSRFEILNDIIKGREVFSNVGAVAKTSTLTRFITAKDDNEKKTLAWGVITTADGTLWVTLRDFRPHVGPLTAVGQREAAERITRDYLESYAEGFNAFIRDLHQITYASRETRIQQPGGVR